ncbi:phosphoglycerol transferase [Franzmannia pantelleriensis]|uniref:Phosphoglycerol transferase n=1 Tax=Franzmannia pantelleriensis TaxID=48727 RepID=A0A1G9L9J1_9GAMM|nr:sulfatase-like hydrolase/transferase [Halomonas pantelleriensis]SDL58640.1 phosphoglycerol transferase [Halomonas pantelleriensis]
MIHAVLRDPRLRQPRWWALLFLGGCLAYATTSLLPLGPWPFFLVAAAWLLAAYLFRWGAPRQPRPPKSVIPWSLVPLLLWWLYVYLAASFGIVDLGAIYFHLQAGMTDHGGASRIVAAIVSTLCALLIVVAFTWLVRNDHRWRLFERILALILLASNPLLHGITQRSAAIVADDGAWLDRRYVEPVIHSAPDTPPNLLFIYIESIERTYADRERFGDAYADFDVIGEQGKVFEGVRQIDNTGWTMAGMIASQCGSPLMPAGLLHDRQFEPLDDVVPGVTCLGDLLSEQGYRQSYLGGASKVFAGKGLFYYGHGFDSVYGREELVPRMEDPEYLNSWGLYDDTLFDFVHEEIRELAAGDAPWNLTTLTIGGHAPHGHPAQRCLDRQGEFDGVDILYSVECNAWLTRELLNDLSDEGLLDNTLVVIASDHLTMRVSVWDELIAGPRDNTFMLLGNDLEPQRIERESSMVDLFPTILEAMGFEIHQHRAGLGASLLSPVQTLLERHQIELINTKLREERELQLRLWDGLAPTARQQQDAGLSEEEEQLPPVM